MRNLLAAFDAAGDSSVFSSQPSAGECALEEHRHGYSIPCGNYCGVAASPEALDCCRLCGKQLCMSCAEHECWTCFRLQSELWACGLDEMADVGGEIAASRLNPPHANLEIAQRCVCPIVFCATYACIIQCWCVQSLCLAVLAPTAVP